MTRNRRTRRLDDRTADALLSGRAVDDEPALSAFVAEARALAPDAPPAPNDALAAMLEHGVAPITAPLAVPARPSRRRLQVAVAVGAALGLVVTAGAANALPGPVQNGVSDVVGWVSPLDLPRADEGDQHAPTPAPSPSRTSEPADEHSSASPEPGDGHGSASPEPGDDKGSSGSGSSGSGSSDDGATSSGSGSSGSGSGSSDDGATSSTSGSTSGSISGSSGSGSSDSGSGGGGSDDHSGSTNATPSPTRSASPQPSPSPTPSDGSSGGSSDS